MVLGGPAALDSSSRRNIGKSVTQLKVKWSSRISSSSRARWSRSAPSTREVSAHSSAAKSSVEPGSARKASSSASERNFAIGERTSPSSSTTRYARPFAPHSLAISSSRCNSLREYACGTRRNRTASAFEKTPNSEPRVTSVASSSSSP